MTNDGNEGSQKTEPQITLEALHERIIALEAATARRFYKVEVYTKRSGEGGTDAAAYISFCDGHGNATPNYYLNSPGGSHEQGNWDVYYFHAPKFVGRIRYDVQLISAYAAPDSDKWTFELFLYQFTYSGELDAYRWLNVMHEPEHTSYPVSHRERGYPSSFPPNAAVHFNDFVDRDPVVDVDGVLHDEFRLKDLKILSSPRRS